MRHTMIEDYMRIDPNEELPSSFETRRSAKEEARRRKEKQRKAKFDDKNQARVERKLRRETVKALKCARRHDEHTIVIHLSNYDVQFLTRYRPYQYVELVLPRGWVATEELGGAYGTETVVTAVNRA